jgi:hypothetical protein
MNCPNCGGTHVDEFYTVTGMPVHSVLLLYDEQEARDYPTGDIVLGLCDECGFIYNTRFDGSLQEYSTRYEGTQSYSPTFTAFARQQAAELIERHDLHNRDIIEIGCGQGEFLLMLCEMGDNRGVGFDPAYRATVPVPDTLRGRVRFVQDVYTSAHAALCADFYLCKMTLEHIDQTGVFMRQVRRAIGDNHAARVVFQIPNATYVLQTVAFWDIYYEHCSYFTPYSLAALFLNSGFDVLDIHTAYDDQYLLIEAQPAPVVPGTPYVNTGTLDAVRQDVETFTRGIDRVRGNWQKTLRQLQHDGAKVVIWGGGSKGVAFLNTLGINGQIRYVVDINPNKRGTYMAGTGQVIVQPGFLTAYRPEAVIVMNPVYCEEIQRTLDELSVPARLIPVA